MIRIVLLALAAAAAEPPPGYLPRTSPPPSGEAPGMSVLRFGPPPTHVYKLTFRPGDDLLAGLQRFVHVHPFAQATMTGIGGFSDAVLSWYDPKAGFFKRIDVPEKVEVAAFTGTVSTDKDGKTTVHAHVALTRSDGSTVSGHLVSATVAPIMEVFVADLGEAQADGATGPPPPATLR